MSKSRLETLLEMYNNNAKDSFIRFALAKEYENLGNNHQALQYYSDLKCDDPDYVGVYYHLAKLFEAMDETEYALNVYNEGIVIAKKQNDFHALAELNNAKINLEMEL